ncbi:MAG TPA: substrate-binding domain-containing protein [Acetobacteraceae bacterium]|jgi:molybdate transport system substrate-binding protein|nr:substrate-binding domain-containing protein [Acetobacteraceae bacterium]
MDAQSKRITLTTALVAIFSAFALSAQAADIKVLSDGPIKPALTKVADLFRQETHTQVHIAFDPWVQKRIEGGEAADVVIVEPDFVEELVRAGKVNAGNRPIIGHVGFGLGNRRDSPAHDISSPEELKQTLLGADTIVFNNVGSGNSFAKVLEKLGIAEVLKPKIVRTTTPDGIFELVLKGNGDDIMAGTIPLIATTPGIKLLGPFPGDLQSYLTFTAVLTTNASQPETAESFIKFLVSSKAKDTFAANGVN